MTSRQLHGARVDEILAEEDTQTGVLWALADNQGTVRDLARFNAQTGATTVTAHRTFSSFGSILTQTDPATNQPVGATSQEGRFTRAYTGRTWDADIGAYHYRRRWYNPRTARFLSQDPAGFAAGDTNLGRYVGNGPTNATDPSGNASAASNVWNNLVKPYAVSAGSTYVKLMKPVVFPIGALYDDVVAAKEYYGKLRKDPGGTISSTAKGVAIDYVDTLTMPFNPYRGAVQIYGAFQDPHTRSAALCRELSSRDGRNLVLAGGIYCSVARVPAPRPAGSKPASTTPSKGTSNEPSTPQATPKPAVTAPKPAVTAIAEDGRTVYPVPSSGYHGLSGMTTEELIANGVPARSPGTNTSLADHVNGAADSAFRGLGPIPGQGGSAGLMTPVEFAREGGLVIEVEGVPGFDTSLHAPNAVARLPRGEAEIATPSRIPTENIRRIGRVTVDSRGREVVRPEDWIQNPNFRGSRR